MKYRDDLEAAQQRIQELQNRVEELEQQKNDKDKPSTSEPSEKEKGTATKGSGGSPGRAAGCAVGGLSGLVLFIVGITVFGTHACVACNSGVTDPALEALRKCPAAREILGDDIGWSVVGCTNYRSGSGGDPINQGCHSSQSFQVPVSGTKGRGSYRFSASQPAGKDNRFTGGSLYVPGQYVSISSDGTCSSHSL
jgi:hypothetical protein